AASGRLFFLVTVGLFGGYIEKVNFGINAGINFKNQPDRAEKPAGGHDRENKAVPNEAERGGYRRKRGIDNTAERNQEARLR
ncbi:MAG: hypothetical protein MJ137_08190, partial [Clostridia bacterium]|nr:hypothetical protein [Clostridia bacterium]